MEYLVRFVQMHETFRQPEIDALADLEGLEIDWVSYSEDSPFAILRFKTFDREEEAAKRLLKRSILSDEIYELWGSGSDYDSLHADIRSRTQGQWPQYRTSSFRFKVDSYRGSRPLAEQRELIETFDYMSFEGPIRMNKPDEHFTIFEDYELDGVRPRTLHFGRLIAESGRRSINKYNLKKRSYIATTSMDAELSLVTANLAQAAPGKLAYDPFMGTGSFPLACAHFGSAVFGSDLDGRSIRGKGNRNVKGNFKQYDTASLYFGGFISDITNTPLRRDRILDVIVCDPPYGVREGLKVLGSTRAALQEVVYLADGTPAHLQANYIPPKKPYSFLRMLDDILDFSAERLADRGRLCMWMPVAGAPEGEETTVEAEDAPRSEYDIPKHPALELVSVCRQDFNKWSRRLLTYRRMSNEQVDQVALLAYQAQRLELGEADRNTTSRATADDLNDFRKKYFQGFKEPGLSGFLRKGERGGT